MKSRLSGRTISRLFARLIEWTLERWFKVGLLLCAVSMAWDVNTFVHRFLVFSFCIFQHLEAGGTLS